MRARLPKTAAWLLCGAAGVSALADAVVLVRFGFRWVPAWWLALSLSAVIAGWSLTRDRPGESGGFKR